MLKADLVAIKMKGMTSTMEALDELVSCLLPRLKCLHPAAGVRQSPTVSPPQLWTCHPCGCVFELAESACPAGFRKSS